MGDTLVEKPAVKKVANQYDSRVLLMSWLNKAVEIIGTDYKQVGILRYVSQFEITLEIKGDYIILFKHSITKISKVKEEKTLLKKSK